MLHHLKNTLFILTGVFFLLTFIAFQGHALSLTTGVLSYTDQAEFETDFPGLPKEDFEESPIADGAWLSCTGPIDNTTNQPGCFVPGDILPGISFDNTTHGLWVLGTGFVPLTTQSVTFGGGTSPLSISFSSNDVHAVGMDLITFNGTDTYTIEVYGAGNVLLSTITTGAISTSGTFFGVYSNWPITRIDLSTAIDEVIDNIQFGTKTTSDVTFYTNQNTFETAHSGLPIEDFEESPVASGAFVIFPEPLDSTTSAPGAFSPGDILEGLQIQTISNANPATALGVLGDHYLGIMENSSKIVCSSVPSDDLRITFPGYNTYAVGMDLLPANPAGSLPRTAHITVHSIFGNPIGTTIISLPRTQETFFGVHSNVLIGWISVSITDAGENECIDNIQFGGSPTGLTFYSTEADFKKVRSNLPIEDFSESPVPDNTPQICSEPLDRNTNEAGCFVPGDILPNISFQTESSLDPACPACMTLYGPNFGPLSNTTPMLMVTPPDSLEVAFSGKKIHFTGMKLYIGIFSIYGPNDTLLATAAHVPTVPALGFWGVKSTEPISRITIYGGGFLSEISFGGKFPWPMYGPATGGAGTSAP